MGFRSGITVTVGGLPAAVTSITPTEITAIAPPSAGGTTGNVDVTITDPVTQGWTTIEGSSGTGLSYGPQSTDGIRIVSAPVNAVRIGVPLRFHRAGDRIQRRLTCFECNCYLYSYKRKSLALPAVRISAPPTTGSDGTATIMVTPTTTAIAAVTASLANGASVTTEFIGAAAPSIAALNGTLYLAQGAIFEWTSQALALSNALPYPGQTVTWSATSRCGSRLDDQHHQCQRNRMDPNHRGPTCSLLNCHRLCMSRRQHTRRQRLRLLHNCQRRSRDRYTDRRQRNQPDPRRRRSNRPGHPASRRFVRKSDGWGRR